MLCSFSNLTMMCLEMKKGQPDGLASQCQQACSVTLLSQNNTYVFPQLLNAAPQLEAWPLLLDLTNRVAHHTMLAA